MESTSRTTSRSTTDHGLEPLRVRDTDERHPMSIGKDAQIVLTLSPVQVDQVIRSATDGLGGGVADGLAAEQGSHARQSRYRSLLGDRRLSRSLLSGLLVLASFPSEGELGIADVARKLDMRTSTTHRYVSTLLAAGLLERDPVSRLYRVARA